MQNSPEHSFVEIVSAWWNALGIDAQIFFAVGGIALAVVLIQALLTLIGTGEFGGDADADVPAGDLSSDAPHDPGLGLISVRTLTAFFMGFGLTGGVILEAGQSLFYAICGGAFVGFLFLLIIWKIMQMLYGLRASGNIDPASAKGKTGTVYVAIPPNGAAGGQVETLVSGRVMTFPAITKSAEKIPAGTLVRVIETLPQNILVVEKN